MQQVLGGLQHLHSIKHQIHRDLKPENILLNSLGQVKLTDFGISKQLESTLEFAKSFIGTMTYMSPERINCKNYSYSSDIWSLGIITYEMATGELPFPVCRKLIDSLRYIGNATDIFVPETHGLSVELKDFIEHCLKKDPAQRPSSSLLLTHKFITDYKAEPMELAKWNSPIFFEACKKKASKQTEMHGEMVNELGG